MALSSEVKNKMHWYYAELGGHVHVRVFMNGALCGNLAFRAEEFQVLLNDSKINFVNDEARLERVMT